MQNHSVIYHAAFVSVNLNFAVQSDADFPDISGVPVCTYQPLTGKRVLITLLSFVDRFLMIHYS